MLHVVVVVVVSGINFLYIFINLILVPVPDLTCSATASEVTTLWRYGNVCIITIIIIIPPFPTQLYLHPSLLSFLIYHSTHP